MSALIQTGRFSRSLVSALITLTLVLGFTATLAGCESAGTTPVAAQESSSEDLLLTAAQLKPLAEDADAQQAGKLRILDIRSADDYAAGHVPGAASMNFRQVAALAKAENGMHDAAAWAAALSPFGITRETRVVIYGGTGVTTNTRAWWLLKYVGVNNVALLDGGWDAWVEAGLEASSESAEYAASEFEPEFQAERMVELSELQQLYDDEGVKVLDTRTIGEFTGQQARGGRGGRIPGATHLNWTELVDDKGRFKSKEELKKLFDEHGAMEDQVCITYCQSGGRASTEAFALEMLGYPKVRVYYASWQEWGGSEETPVQTGASDDGD